MERGRPKRYKYTQRWLEHEKNCQHPRRILLLGRVGGVAQSFWQRPGTPGSEQGEKESVDNRPRSTFKAWWSELPDDHKTETISGLMNGSGNMQVQ
ncbi:hypothetical protein PS1_039386 [Malus domestica]